MEKRAHPRYESPSVYIRTGGSAALHSCGLINGKADRRDVLDIGRGGLAFISPFSPPQKGSHISVDLYMSEESPPHMVRGDVVWAEDVSGDPPPDAAAIWRQSSPFASHRVGVKFSDIPESLAATIDQLASVGASPA